MNSVPDPKTNSRLASWAGYAAGVCALAGIVAKYLTGSWMFGPVPYVFFIAAVIFFIAYCLIDGAKSPGHAKRKDGE